jgi:hypothetical protein
MYYICLEEHSYQFNGFGLNGMKCIQRKPNFNFMDHIGNIEIKTKFSYPLRCLFIKLYRAKILSVKRYFLGNRK